MPTAAPATAPLHMVNDPDRAATMLHPLRRRILGELAGPESAAGLARRLGLPRQRLNYHLRQLERQGLVEAVGRRRKRGCTERLVRAVARSYLISPAALGTLAADPEATRDAVSSAYLAAVAAQAIDEVGMLRQRAEAAGKQVPTLTLQSEVRFASPAAQHAFGEELAAELGRLVARYHSAAAPDGRSFRVVAAAWPAAAKRGAA